MDGMDAFPAFLLKHPTRSQHLGVEEGDVRNELL